jgi:hypothetical protein
MGGAEIDRFRIFLREIGNYLAYWHFFVSERVAAAPGAP